MSNQESRAVFFQRALAKHVTNKLKSDMRAQSMPAMEANLAPNTLIVKWYDLEFIFDLIHQYIDGAEVQEVPETAPTESKSETKRKAYQNKAKREEAELEKQRAQIAEIEANNPKPKRGRPSTKKLN